MGDDRLQVTNYKLQIINFGTGAFPTIVNYFGCGVGRGYTFSPARKYAKSRRKPFVWFSDSPDDQRESPLESPVGLSRRPKGEPFGITRGEQIVNDQLPVARCLLSIALGTVGVWVIIAIQLEKTDKLHLQKIF